MGKKEGNEFIKKLQSLQYINDELDLIFIENKINSASKSKLDAIKVLIIEDHIQIIESYVLIFGLVSKKLPNKNFALDIATSCEDAIFKLKSDISYDMILLDIELPPYPKERIFSGEDISLWIDKHLSIRPKIIINTYFTDKYRIYNLYKNINPDGFLTKYEADSQSFIEVIIRVLESPPFYSSSILKMIRENFAGKEVLNAKHRKLLYELSQGATTKDLAKSFICSTNTIVNMKTTIFELLDIENKTLKSLLAEAKKLGFI